MFGVGHYFGFYFRPVVVGVSYNLSCSRLLFMYSIRRCTVVCLKLVYLFTNIGNVNNKHCSQYSDVTSLQMVVGLSVDLLSPASVSHQGLLGNPNLTVAQILWILHHS